MTAEHVRDCIEVCKEHRHLLVQGLLVLGGLVLWRLGNPALAAACGATFGLLLYPGLQHWLIVGAAVVAAVGLVWSPWGGEGQASLTLMTVAGGAWAFFKGCEIVVLDDRLPVENKFATWRSLHRAGLLRPGGIPLGTLPDSGDLVWFDQPGHVLCIGPTRSGKSSGLLIPALLSEGDAPQGAGSWVVNDPKGELYATTGGYRATCGRVVRFAPCDPTSQRYNPLAAIPWGTPQERRHLSLVAQTLSMPDGDLTTDSGHHFQSLAQALLMGLIAYGRESGKATTLGQVATVALETAVASLEADLRACGQAEARAAGALLQSLAGEEKSGAISSTRKCLDVYADPVIARAVSGSDFALRDLRDGPPLSVYTVLPFADLHRLRGLHRLLIRQWADYAMSQQQAAWPHRLTFALDEFPSLRRLGCLEDMLQAAAGSGVRMLLLSPGLRPIWAAYGEQQPFTENCTAQVYFPGGDAWVNQLIAGRTGTTRRARTSWNTTRGHSLSMSGGGHSASSGTSTQLAEEPLLAPTSFSRLSPGHLLAFVGQERPMILQAASYWQQPTWQRRGQLPPP